MSTNGLQVVTVRRLLYPDTNLHRVAYTVAAAAAALQVPQRRVRELLHNGQIPARNTGNQYLITGATLVIINRGPLTGINDHRDPAVFDVARLYTRSNLRSLLGTTVHVVRSLVENGRIKETESIGSARYVTGETIWEFLGGRDEPMRQRDTA